MNKKEKHLDIYQNRYELYQEDSTVVYYQGFQNKETQERYKLINNILKDGYLEHIIETIQNQNFSNLSVDNQELIKNLVEGVTSEVGRALVGLTCLQLAIKSIAPQQSVRLHKGSTRRGSFSWVNGISMRVLDKQYNTPFLRKYDLLKLNRDGVFMTRSLAENYPYTSLYKAEMKGPFEQWISIVDEIENGNMEPKLGLYYLISLLKNRSEKFRIQANKACVLTATYVEKNKSFSEIRKIISKFFNDTDYSARAFEISLHAFYQAMEELQLLGNVELVPLSQMRSANKKHKNVGDIELQENDVIIEAWDAKYGKPYLRDELEELRDKLLTHVGVKLAGFICDSEVDMRKEIVRRIQGIEDETGVEIHIYSFEQWLDFECRELTDNQKEHLASKWIMALAESLAQKRIPIAPIDEPCDEWIHNWIAIMDETL